MGRREDTTGAVPCPLCGAGAGQPCQGKRRPRLANHDERQAVMVEFRRVGYGVLVVRGVVFDLRPP